jgi:3'(2'), 5'-bisphosphate nucleotidase
MKFDKILSQLIELTAKVGDKILSHYKNDFKIELKADKTPLTIADKEAHQSIGPKFRQLQVTVFFDWI